MADIAIPPGYGVPLVNLTTDLFPAPTMNALDARYGGSGGDPGFEYVQSTPLATWTIPVPGAMGRRPNVAVFVGGEMVETDVTASPTEVVVTFPEPVAGTAVLT
jgi:hypothetical protein